MKKEKMIKKLNKAIDELDKDLFFEIFSPFSYYNNSLIGGIDTFAFNTNYEDITLIELYNLLKDMEDDINEMMLEKTQEWGEDEDGNDWMDDYNGFDWLPIVRFFMIYELSSCGYYVCLPPSHKSIIK